MLAMPAAYTTNSLIYRFKFFKRNLVKNRSFVQSAWMEQTRSRHRIRNTCFTIIKRVNVSKALTTLQEKRILQSVLWQGLNLACVALICAKTDDFFLTWLSLRFCRSLFWWDSNFNENKTKRRYLSFLISGMFQVGYCQCCTLQSYDGQFAKVRGIFTVKDLPACGCN